MCSKAMERKVRCLSKVASIYVSRGQTLLSYAYSVVALLVSGVALAVSFLGTLYGGIQRVGDLASLTVLCALTLLAVGLAILLARYVAPRLIADDIERLLRIKEVNRLLKKLRKYCEKLGEVLKLCRDLCEQGEPDDKLLCSEVEALTQSEERR